MRFKVFLKIHRKIIAQPNLDVGKGNTPPRGSPRPQKTKKPDLGWDKSQRKSS